MQKPVVCHITSVHSALDIRIFEKECKSLSENYQVHLIHPGIENLKSDNVNVIGINYKETNRLKRILNTGKKVVEKALTLNAEVYHFHDPELLRYTSRLKKNGAKVIYDSHEDLPKQVLDKPYLPKSVRGFISVLVEYYERKNSSKLNGVITATQTIKKRFDKYNKNVCCIYNYPILDRYTKNLSWVDRPKSAVYIGGIFEKRGIWEITEAITKTDSSLELAGKFSPQELKDKVLNKHQGDNVNYHGFLDKNGINKLLESTNIGLVTLHPTKSYLESLPIKMFEYMAAGLPVIASNFPFWKQIIEKHECGICVDPLNPKEISDAIIYLNNNPEIASKMGENGKTAAFELYSWQSESDKLTEFYKSLTS